MSADREALWTDTYVDDPTLGKWYIAGDLPAGSVVSATTQAEYVIGRSGLCMRWEQPIPGSDSWRVRYDGRLPQGIWMTHRERAEVDEARERRSDVAVQHNDGK